MTSKFRSRACSISGGEKDFGAGLVRQIEKADGDSRVVKAYSVVDVESDLNWL
jgi:hypothetical protein